MMNYKILVAEDDPITAQVIAKTLDNLEISYTLVDDGEKAINECKYDYYDMVLLDMIMPNKDGFTTSKELRRISNSLPIVAFTSLSYTDISKKLAESGINHYLGKPRQLDTLQMLLKHYFRTAA